MKSRLALSLIVAIILSLVAGCGNEKEVSISGKLAGTTFWTKIQNDAYNANLISRTVSENFLGGGATSATSETDADWLIWISSSGLSNLRVVVKYHGSIALQGDYYPEYSNALRFVSHDVGDLNEGLRGIISRFSQNRDNLKSTETKK